MYKILFVALLTVLIACESVSAQSVTISDLFRFHQLSHEQMDDVATAKGFTYQSPHELAEGYIRYPYKRFKSLGGVYQQISIFYYLERGLIMTAYSTTSQPEYTGLKNQLKQRGYQYTSTKSLENVTEHYYESRTSPKYSASIMLSLGEETGEVTYIFCVKEDALYDAAFSDMRKEN